jgi:hypothetical protein
MTTDPMPMISPVRCTHCRHVYDLAAVSVVARYADCSVWQCPGCKLQVDDRGDTGWKTTKDYVRVEEAPDLYGQGCYWHRER